MWFHFCAAFFLALSLPLFIVIAVLSVLVRKLQYRGNRPVLAL